jgi:hypothetical protein
MDYDELMASRGDTVNANGMGVARHVIGCIGWVSTANIERRPLVDISRWGGFLEKGDDWSVYIANIDKDFVPHHESLRLAIIARGLRRGGDWHQNSQNGVSLMMVRLALSRFAPGAT